MEFEPDQNSSENHNRLAGLAERMVVSDPEIMRGTPVFRGTRIPVHAVADMLADGATIEELLEGYPTLTRENIEFAAGYAEAFPDRGLPPDRPWADQQPIRVTTFYWDRTANTKSKVC